MTTSHKIALSLGTLAVTLSATSFAAGANPFEFKTLSNGYQVAEHDAKGAEGKCGTGKCGANKKAKDGACKHDKAKEGSCSAEKMKEGSCSAEKMKEGKCAASK